MLQLTLDSIYIFSGRKLYLKMVCVLGPHKYCLS